MKGAEKQSIVSQITYKSPINHLIITYKSPISVSSVSGFRVSSFGTRPAPLIKGGGVALQIHIHIIEVLGKLDILGIIRVIEVLEI